MGRFFLSSLMEDGRTKDSGAIGYNASRQAQARLKRTTSPPFESKSEGVRLRYPFA